MKNLGGPFSKLPRILFAGLVGWVALAPKPVFSQAVYGSIVGTVKGVSGEAIGGAIITATSVQKGTKQRAASNSSGSYNFNHLLPDDDYNVAAEAQGYQSREFKLVEVSSDQAVSLDLQLEKGSQVGPAQISQAGLLLKTDRADVSTTLTAQEVHDLPNFSRNFTAFELLVPGALSSPIAENTSRPSQNPQQGLTIYQNGQHFGGSAFLLDGTDNRDPIAGLIVINPSLEAISEIKITTQNFDAEFGQALAGLVTAQTRSGSNSWHGNAFDYRHTDWAEASAPNLQNSNVIQNPFRMNQFGGSIGGPIVRNRLFVFGDYQGNRRAFYITKFTSVPTETVRSTCLDATKDCDLSEYGKSLVFPSIQDKTDPLYAYSGMPLGTGPLACKDQTGGSMCIPHAVLSPQALYILQNYLPAPTPSLTIPDLPPPTVQNYEASGVEPWNDDEFDLRVDQNVSQKLKLFARYSFFDARIDAHGVFGDLVGGPGLSSDGFAGSSRSRNQSVSSGFDYFWNPSLSTDFRFGFYRYHVNVLQGVASTNPAPATDAGINGLNLGDLYTSGMPGFVIKQPAAAVTSNITFGYSQEVDACNCPLLENEQQFQWANNWTKVRGNHSVKWGVDFRYARNLRVPSDRHRAGHLVFNPQTTEADNGTGGLGLATFLLGYASSFDRYVSPTLDYSAGERQHRYFFYGQDSWRLNSRFTLTYGLRWEIYVPQSVTAAGQGGFLDASTGMVNVAGLGSTNLSGNIQDSFKNFAPRFGFAYRALSHTVIRGGYGRSFDLGSLGAVFGDTVTQNLPVLEFEQFFPQFPKQEVFDLRNSAPTISVPPTIGGRIQLPPGIAANLLPNRTRIPTIDAWNLTVQQQLNSKTSLEIAYVANKGTHVFPEESSNQSKTAAYNLNQATIQGFIYTGSKPTANCAPNPDGTTPALPCISLLSTRQPFSNFGWTQEINYFANNANDNYESMQAKLERRLTRDFQFDAAYTWSKGLGYVQDYYRVDPFINYGPNDFDRAHAFILSTLWDLPFGRGKAVLGNASGWLNRLAGGWNLDTISYVYSGLPFTPTYSNCAADADTGPCRPNRVGAVHITGNRNDYFTLTSSQKSLSSGKFTCDPNNCTPTLVVTAGETSGPWQRPAPGTFGNVSRNSFRGPGYFNTDLAVLKNFTLSERSALQFRAELANVFNKVNLGLPNPCVDCYQKINGASTNAGGVIANLANGASMRQWQFALELQF